MKTFDQAITMDVFKPLANFFEDSPTDFNDIKKIIDKKGPPEAIDSNINIKKGFLLETYVIYTLLRFKERYRSISSINNLESFGPKDSVVRKKWGNYQIKKYGGPNPGTEIDALFEYEKNKNFTPIIFEISYRRHRKLSRDVKKSAIKNLLHKDPYFCLIRPAIKKENPGLYTPYSNCNDKKIIIPEPIGLEEILK